jgi:long-chain acyl-CoA synthetase
MAVASLGAVVVPINFQLTPREIAYIVKDAQMQRLITMEKLDLDGELETEGRKYELTQLILPDVKVAIHRDTYDVAPPLSNEFNEDHPCVIIYTSGTTGNPKGAVLTHKNLVSNAHGFWQVLPVTSADTVLCVLPMYHCFAWTCAVLNSLLAGASITILDAFVPKETIAAIREYGVTVMYGVPPMYNFLLRTASSEDLEKVKIFVSGGASLPEQIAKQFRQKFGVSIIEGYGLSEASPVVSINPVGKTKYCSIGKALPGLEVKIIDSKGDVLPPGEVGELIVRGPSVMQGYFNLPLETTRAIRNGWLHTGDVAYQDAEGYLFIVDRLKDMIITNGENIYPREIEELLYSYPGVTEAAVIGIPDELRGQAACAYVVLEEGRTLDKRGIKEFLHQKLAAYKMPKEFIQVPTLPKNQTGKILKRVLRDQVAKDRDGEKVG